MQIGEILREAREERNISLDEIQEETKIQKRYLVAMEQDDFHALPGKFYARAFIKEYAQAVGLDPTEVLNGFDEENIQPEEETMQYTRLERSKRPKSTKSSSFWSVLPTIIVIILVIGILFVAWSLYQSTLTSNDKDAGNLPENDEIIRNVDGQDKNDDNSEDSNDNADSEKDGEEDSSDEESVNEGTFTVAEKGTGNSPLSTMDFTYGDEEVEVSFNATAASYVQLKGADESVYFEGTLDPDSADESFTVTDEERIYFNIGNASGLTVYINGVELEYPVETSVVHQKLWINLNKSE